MRLSKLDLLLIAAFITGAIFIERENRIRIEVPAPEKVSEQPAAACPVNESVPFSAECMAFIQGARGPAGLRRPSGITATLADSPELP
jgi:hypothetical protein